MEWDTQVFSLLDSHSLELPAENPTHWGLPNGLQTFLYGALDLSATLKFRGRRPIIAND